MKQKEIKFKNKLDKVKSIDGSGTQLVSLYIPSDSNINKYRQRIQDEIAEADNIKSKETKKNVKSALKKISSILKKYKKNPDNGLVLFASEEKIFVFDNELPNPINSSIYKCDSSFYIDPLEEIISNNKDYILLIVTENKASIGYLKGRKVSEEINLESNLHGKHRAGGQSSQRWSRDRKEKKKQYYKDIGKNLDRLKENSKNLLIGGPNITRKEFIDQDVIPHDINIIGQFNVNYTGLQGLRELAEKSKNVIENEELKQEKDILDKFFKSLRKDKDAYGKEKVKKYIEQGRVETLLLSEDINQPELEKKTKNKGGDVFYISKEHKKGEQFTNNFGGIGAILRW